jgi:hypothetical protein
MSNIGISFDICRNSGETMLGLRRVFDEKWENTRLIGRCRHPFGDASFVFVRMRGYQVRDVLTRLYSPGGWQVFIFGQQRLESA